MVHFYKWQVPCNQTISDILKLVIGYEKLHLTGANKVIFTCKRYFHITSGTRYNFVFDSFFVSRTVFEIETLTLQFADRWRFKWSNRVVHRNFIIYKHIFHEYNCRRIEVNDCEQGFSGHPVFMYDNWME